jgi:hypothetical protein
MQTTLRGYVWHQETKFKQKFLVLRFFKEYTSAISKIIAILPHLHVVNRLIAPAAT